MNHLLTDLCSKRTNFDSQTVAQTPVSQTSKCSEFLKCYLICAAKTEPIENRYENVCRNKQAQEVGAAQEPVLRPMCVNLRWSSQNGHR